VDHDFIRDLFAPFGPVTVRHMFSGAGIFADGLMFGLVVRDVIYLKVDDTNRADFEREGCAPFTYTRGKKSGRPSEHALPIGACPSGSTTIPRNSHSGQAGRSRRRSGRTLRRADDRSEKLGQASRRRKAPNWWITPNQSAPSAAWTSMHATAKPISH
jgi:hypothetical protein